MAVQLRPQSTEVAGREEEGPRSVVQLLESDSARRRIAPFLPRGIDYDRVVAAAYLAWKKNEDLHRCTGESLVLAVARIVSWDLEIGETAHLVRFGNEATAIADYKGLIELVIRSGAVRAVDAHEVYEGDHFEYELGLEPKLVHRPAPAANRGKLAYAYVIFRLPYGLTRLEVMPIEDIDAIRKTKSRQWKNGDCPPWYAIKTVIRRGVKQLPKNPRLAKALAAIDGEEQLEMEGEAGPVAIVDEPRPQLAAPAHEGRNSVPMAGQGSGWDYDSAPEPIPPRGTARPVPTVEVPPPAAGAQHVAAQAAAAPDPYALEGDVVPEGGEARSQSQSAPASVTPPSSAPARELVEKARAFRNPFRNSASYGKPLGEFTIDGLQALVEWIAKVRKETGEATKHAGVFDAAQVLIADAEAQQTQLPLDAPAPPAVPSGTTLAPGKVEDALAQARAADPQDDRIAELTAQLQQLLEDPAFTPADSMTVRRKLAAGALSTVPALEAEIDRLQRLADVPF